MKTENLVIGFICVAIALTGCESKPDNSHNTGIDVVSFDEEDSSNDETEESGSSVHDVSDLNLSGTYYNPSVPTVQQNTTDYQEYQPHEEYCRACNGTGTCHACNGTGQQVSAMSLASDETVYRNCGACNGTGTCCGCGGDGKITEGIDY
mgnify:CR=1 FL=1